MAKITHTAAPFISNTRETQSMNPRKECQIFQVFFQGIKHSYEGSVILLAENPIDQAE